MKTFMVEPFYFLICFHCYVIAQQLPSLTYAVAISLYQIIRLSLPFSLLLLALMNY